MGGEKRAREQDGNEATGEVEIAFDRQYDRQIRLWGKNAQNRMSKAKVLVFGMRGLSVEICKNIVLAGIGKVSIMDDGVVLAEDLGANFFISESDVGSSSRAEASVGKMRELNPRVAVEVLIGDCDAIDEDRIKGYDVVCVTGVRQKQQLRINEICRKGSISFFSADSYGLFSTAFFDLNTHKFTVETKKRADETTQESTVKSDELVFPSLEKALKASWSKIPNVKKVSTTFCCLQAVQTFFDETGKFPEEGDKDAMDGIKSSLSEAHGVSAGMFDDGLISIIAAQGEAGLTV